MAQSREHTATIDPVQTGCLRALGMLASGRAWLIFLITLAVVIQVGLFGLAWWGEVLHERIVPVAPGAAPEAAPAEPQNAAPAPAGPSVVPLLDQAAGVRVQHVQAHPAEPEPPPVLGPGPQTVPVELVPVEPAPAAGAPSSVRDYLRDLLGRSNWEHTMRVALPISGFVGLAAAMLLVVVTFLAVQVNLIGRLAALPAMISAFYWALLTTTILFPWGSIVGETLGGRIPWAFYDFRELFVAVEASRDALDVQPLIWARFVIWPIVGLLAAWMCGARFGKSYWQAVGLSELEAKTRSQLSREI